MGHCLLNIYCMGNSYFRDTNPEAYHELLDVIIIENFNRPNIRELRIDDDLLSKNCRGKWKCKFCGNIYYAAIHDRAYKETDSGCLFCLCKKRGYNFSIISQKTNTRHNITSLIHNKATGVLTWKLHLDNVEAIEYLNNEIEEEKELLPWKIDSLAQLNLSVALPKLANEWSKLNHLRPEEVSRNSETAGEYPIKWNCSICGNTYEMDLSERICAINLNRCPFCNGEQPVYEKSLEYLYPEIAGKLFEPMNKGKTGVNFFTDRGYAYFECKDCGIVEYRNIAEVILEKECSYCRAGLTRELTDRIREEHFVEKKNNPFISYDSKRKVKDRFECKSCKTSFWASLKERYNLKAFCPNCIDVPVLERKIIFKTLYPEIEEELIYDEHLKNIDTDNIRYSDYRNLALQWKCSNCKMEFQASMYDRVKNPKCPYCTGILAIPGKTSFKALYPEIEKTLIHDELVNFDTDAVIYADYQDALLHWKCPDCSMDYSAMLYERVISPKHGCPYCNGKMIIPGKTSFKALYPNLEKTLIRNDRLTFAPEKVMYTEHRSIQLDWKCSSCNMVFQASMYDRVEKVYGGCPYCSSERAIPGKTSFKALYPEIEKTLVYDKLVDFDTDYIFPTKYKDVCFNWNCHDCGMAFSMSMHERTATKDSCPYCSGKKAIPGKTSFKALYPEIEKTLIKDEQVTFDTDRVFYTEYKNNKLNWKCPDCNMVFQALMYDRVTSEKCCPYCSGKKAIPGKTSLKALYPKLIANEWKYQNNALLCHPNQILPNSNCKVWWVCSSCKFTYLQAIHKRVKNYERNKIACPFCKGMGRIKYWN